MSDGDSSMVGQFGGFIALMAMVAIAGPAYFLGLIAANVIRSVPWMLTHPLGAIWALVVIVVAIVFLVGPVLGIVWIIKRRPQR